MDRPLTSHRDDRGGSRDYGGGGGGGGYRGGYGGGGRGRGRGGRYRGGGGGGYRGGGGRGRGRGRRNDYNSSGGGSSYEPYGGRGVPFRGGRIVWRGGGGGGGDRSASGGGERQGNRFYAEQQFHDPRSTILKQLNELLHQVGQLPQEETAPPPPPESESETTNESPPEQRWVVQTMSKNVQSLATVLCAKSDMFLQSQSTSGDASLVAGPLASGLVQAAAAGPLQTHCYTALTLAVQQQQQQQQQQPDGGTAVSGSDTYGGGDFARRTVQYAVRLLARDLDALLLLVDASQLQQQPDFSSPHHHHHHHNKMQSPPRPEPLARIAMRVRLVLRYLGLLSQLGIVAQKNAPPGVGDEEIPPFDSVVTVTNHQEVSFFGLLQSLVQAATLLLRGGGGAGGDEAHVDLALILAQIVYSTVPYLMAQQQQQQQQNGGNGQDASSSSSSAFWQEQILQPLQTILESYQSDFEPGVGPKAILLKYEQLEPTAQDAEEEEEEEEEEEDEDEDGGASNQVCDSLQDLNRCVQTLFSSLMASDDQQQEPKHRFALFTDAPWKALTKPKPPSSALETEGEAAGGDASATTAEAPAGGEATAAPLEPLVYTGEPICLAIFPECISLTVVLGGPVAVGADTTNILLATHRNLSGIVVGRLPIFGSPRGGGNEQDGDGEGEDEDEGMEEDGPKNERLETYSKTFGLVDRYFLAEAVRDCLLSHEPKVTDAGVERGSIKAVAEQVWSIRQLLLAAASGTDNGETGNAESAEDNENNNNEQKKKADKSVGLEFVVVEVVLSLIVQACISNASSSNPNHNDVLELPYLSRVLLELVKLEPVPMASAIVQAVATLVEDYMPSLVPTARYNLSQWFAFHLTHSNYQWPPDYWKHWEPFVLNGRENSSRGVFVKDALTLMMENVSDPSFDLLAHIPISLGETLVPSEVKPCPPQVDTLIHDLSRRIWDMQEEPFTILPYLISDELQESLAADIEAEPNGQYRLLWRTKVLVQALLSPAYREQMALRRSILAQVQRQKDGGGDGEDNMDQEPIIDDENDVLSQFMNGIPKYRALLDGVAAKETAANAENNEQLLLDREGVMLDHIAESSGFSRAVFTTVTKIFVKEKIISPMGVVRWCLGENASATVRWWEPCETAIRIGGRRLHTVVSDYGSMVMDDNTTEDNNNNAGSTAGTTNDTGQEKSRNVRNAEMFVEFAAPLLKHVVEQSSVLLNNNNNNATTTGDGGGENSKKLSPRDIVVMEGCKRLVRVVKETFFSCLEEVRISNNLDFVSEISAVYNSSPLKGQSLAELCTGDNLCTKVLVQSLERS